MSLSKKHSFIHLIPLAVTLILFTCQKQVFDNPHDATSAADPSSWAPSNLQAQVLADSTIKLTWKHEAENIEGFKIDKQVGSLAWMQAYALLAKTDREWIDTNKVFDTTLTYRLYAYAGSNYSTYDSITSFIQSVRGCTDPEAANYNPQAQVDDGSCIYPLIVISPNGGEEWLIGSEQTITWERNDLSRMIGGDFDLPQNKLITKKKRADKKSKMVINRRKNPQVPIMKGSKNSTMDRTNIKDKIQELIGTVPLAIDNDSGKVKIELYSDGIGETGPHAVYATITESTDDDGSYSWTIPSTYSGGSTYKIRISYITDTSVYAESEGYLTLLPGELPTEGLVAYYPFNGNANDESGNGNNGTVNGATLTTDRFGNESSAYSFDGDDYINTNNYFSTANNGMSVCAWIESNADEIAYDVIWGSWGHNTYGASGAGLFLSVESSDRVRSLLWGSDEQATLDLYGSTWVNDNNWHHVCSVYDNSETYLYLYVNSSIENSGIINLNDNFNQERDAYIGAKNDVGTANGFFEGFLDDIHIYNRALNETEITELYCDGGWCIGGCIDINATNYNANANIDDGSCTYITTTDIDGNTYNTVQIGTQLWIAENLKVTRYQNGEEIPNITNNGNWNSLTTGAYGDYDNTPLNSDTYGRLYNWHAVDDDRGICPENWHVPSDDEYKQLEMYLGMSESEANDTAWRGTNEGGKLKEAGTSHWISPNNGGTNLSGFTALPSGTRSSGTGEYSYLGKQAMYWSSSVDGGTAWRRQLYYDEAGVDRNKSSGTNGLSVRCLADEITIGCTDPGATNYNENATADDGSCIASDFIFFTSADNKFLEAASNGNSFTKLLNEVSDAGFTPAYFDLRTNFILQSTFDQKKIVMFLGGSLMNREFTADEISSVNNFVLNGGGIFFTGNIDFNDLTQIFGITLSGNNGGSSGLDWPLSNIDATYFTSNSITNNISRITGDAGDEIAVITPAEYIGWTEEGGTPLLANSEMGFGRVILWYGIGTFLDATIAGNAFQSNIDEYDNRQFLRNSLDWLSKNEESNSVAYYPFNGNANDASGNGNDGTINGATPTTDRFGNENSAYSFDGINSYINGNRLDDLNTARDFSVSVWFNSKTFSADGIDAIINNYNNTNDRFCIFLYKSKIMVSGYDADWTQLQNSIDFTINQWHHVVVTWEEPDIVTLYVNNDNSYNEDSNDNAYGEISQLGIGAIISDLGNNIFNGYIDDIQVYNKVLTKAEITELYCEGGWCEQEEGLVAYYPFNGNANDASNNGNDGTIYGDVQLTTDRFGYANSAYSFDGVDDYIAGTTALGAMDYMTVSAWVYITDVSDQPHIISKYNSNSSKAYWQLLQNFDEIRLSTSNTGSISDAMNQWTTVNADLAENTWYYITAVSFQNGANHEIYINGEVVNGTHTGDNDVGIADGNVPLTISSAWCADGNQCGFFKGKIDEVRIWHQKLTQSEIQELYCEGGWCIEGCTDINATNYNANANIDDDSCEYELTDGLVAYYPFNGNSDDASGNGNHGQAYGAVTDEEGVTGIINQSDLNATSFDGIDDRVSVPNQNSYNIIGAITFGGWFYWDGFGQNMGLIGKGAFDAEYGLHFDNSFEAGTCTDGTSGIQTSLPSGGSFELCNTEDLFEVGNWYHIYYVYNGVDTQYLYVNGSLLESDAVSGSFSMTSAGIDIGSIQSADFFKGKIQDVNIYDTNLSSAQISSLYQSGSPTQLARDIINTDLVYNNSLTYNKGTVIEFDGTDDYLYASDSDSIEILGDVSFGTWLFIDSEFVGEEAIISKGGAGESESANANYYMAGIRGTSKNKIRYLHEYGGGTNEYLDFDIDISVSKWTHVFFTREVSTKNVSLYINGEYIDDDIYTNVPTGGTSSPLYIGINGNIILPFEGKLDEVRIYNRALSASEIQALYQQ